MCLDQVHPKKPEPKGRGWKIFKKVRRPDTGAVIVNDYWPSVIGRCDPYVVGKWYEAHETTISNEKRPGDIRYKEYTSGFHIFMNRADAEISINYTCGYDDVIREIEYDEAHTQGTGQITFPGPQVIAKRMRILPEVERTDFHAKTGA